jgi:hypothetical protein
MQSNVGMRDIFLKGRYELAGVASVKLFDMPSRS